MTTCFLDNASHPATLPTTHPDSVNGPVSGISARLAGQRLLLTGASGFLGKGILEKLLWSIPRMERIFILLRPSGPNRDPEHRLSSILAAPAFDRLRGRHGAGFDRFCRERIVVVSGDVSQPALGLAPENYSRLVRESTSILHCAASVSFNESWDVALQLNTLGPLSILQLARDAGNIPFVHVSTCYVSGKRQGSIGEELVPLDPGMQLASWVERELQECSNLRSEVEEGRHDAPIAARLRSPAALRRWSNTPRFARKAWLAQQLIERGSERAQQLGWNDAYTLTKALGEHLLDQQRGQIPLRIVRPSIIESTHEEPHPGWIEGFKVSDPLIVACGQGKLGCFVGNPNVQLDLIPCDHVVNACLAALAHCDKPGLEIFQVASSSRNPLGLERMCHAVAEGFRRQTFLPSSGSVATVVSDEYFQEHCKQWRAGVAAERHREIDRCEALVRLYSFYTSNDVRFRADNTQRLFASLSDEDRALFPFDIASINWDNYLIDQHIPALCQLAASMGMGRQVELQGKLDADPAA